MVFLLVNLIIFFASLLAVLFLIFKNIKKISVLEEKKLPEPKIVKTAVGFVKNKGIDILLAAVYKPQKAKPLKPTRVKKQKLSKTDLIADLPVDIDSTASDTDYWQNVKEV